MTLRASSKNRRGTEKPVFSAAATGTAGPAGAFIYCDIYQAASPFCQPKEGAMVKPDLSYYSKLLLVRASQILVLYSC